MERRSFLRYSALVSAGVLVAPGVLANNTLDSKKSVTILHTNDTHSNIDPFPDNHARYPGKGGVARRYELIQNIRSEEDNVLLLDAGDIFQGTPYFNKYGGLLEMKLMTELGYEAATMGNHDFDAGLEGFVKACEYADFPFLCANYDFKNTPIDGVTQKMTVIQKGEIKVGVFGLGVELDGLVPRGKFGETKYIDPIDIANDCSKELKSRGCDLVICLSHLGYEYNSNKVSDRQLANKTRDIHLIIGGHTHTFLNRPTEEKNMDGKSVLINQVGWAGVNIGRVDFHIDKKKFAKKDVLIVE